MFCAPLSSEVEILLKTRKITEHVLARLWPMGYSACSCTVHSLIRQHKGRNDDSPRFHHRIPDPLWLRRRYRRPQWRALGTRLLHHPLGTSNRRVPWRDETQSKPYSAKHQQMLRLAIVLITTRSTSQVTSTTTLASTPHTTLSTTALGLWSWRKVCHFPYRSQKMLQPQS